MTDLVRNQYDIFFIDVMVVDVEDNFDGGTLNLPGVLAGNPVPVNSEGRGADHIWFDGANITYGDLMLNATDVTLGAAENDTFVGTSVCLLWVETGGGFAGEEANLLYQFMFLVDTYIRGGPTT